MRCKLRQLARGCCTTIGLPAAHCQHADVAPRAPPATCKGNSMIRHTPFIWTQDDSLVLVSMPKRGGSMIASTMLQSQDAVKMLNGRQRQLIISRLALEERHCHSLSAAAEHQLLHWPQKRHPGRCHVTNRLAGLGRTPKRRCRCAHCCHQSCHRSRSAAVCCCSWH